ncbi:MAG: hypothetical protein ACK4N5_12640 [Myxococcales bacterium]
MPKQKGGYRDNADYFVLDGTNEGRRGYARQRQKLTTGRVSTKGSKKTSRHPDAKPADTSIHIPAPIGAGAETLRLAQEKREAREQVRAQRSQTRRVLDTAAPTVAGDHSLPPARKETVLQDVLRDIQEHATIAGRAARELYGSMGSLVRAPGRLMRAIWYGREAHA